MERSPLSSLTDQAVELHYAGDGVHMEIRHALTEQLLATVSINDLFDKDGNRFEDNIQ